MTILPHGAVIRLHHGQRVLVLDHRDCGAYKVVLGEDFARDPGQERARHTRHKVMSLSAAAVHCIQNAGSPRETANRGVMWKTVDGTYLSEFYDKVYATAVDEPGSVMQQAASADA